MPETETTENTEQTVENTHPTQEAEATKSEPAEGTKTETAVKPNGEAKANGQEAPKQESTPESTDWREGIKDEEARKIAERYSDVNELAKSQLELRQKLSKAVFVPGKKATEDEISAFRKALDIPEKIEDYQLDVPKEAQEALSTDAAKESLKSFAEIAHKSGVPKEAFKNITGEYFRQALAAEEAAKKADEEFATQAQEQLKSDWGASYDREIEYANRGVEWVFGDGVDSFRELKTGSDRLLGDHPLIVRAMNKIGRAISEDVVPMIPATSEEVGDLHEELNKLTAEQDKAQREGDTQKAANLDRKIMQISKKISGDTSV